MQDREPRKQVYIPPEGKGMTIEQEEMASKIVGNLKKDEPFAKWQHFTPDFVDTKSAEVDPNKLIQEQEIQRRIRLENKLGQESADVNINTDLPVSIVHIGDTHIGSVFTNMSEVLRKVKKVINTPNTYVAFMGNIVDNAIPSQYPDNMLNNTFPPEQQVPLAQSIIKRLDDEGKIIVAVESPCHEGWSYKKAGQDVNRLIYGYKGRKFPVLTNGGDLNLKIGEQEYKGRLYHQTGPFESNFNKTHSLKQLARLDERQKPDWVAGAHRHVAATENVYEGRGKGRRQTVYLRSGCEKGTGDLPDTYIQSRRGVSGEPTGQTIHLFPNKRKILSTLDFDDAMEAHEAYYLYEMAKNGINAK